MTRSIINNLIFSYKYPSVDNFIFRLVYRWTFWKLLLFSFIVTCRLAFGDSFKCASSYDTVSQSFLDTRCYSETIVSYPNRPDGGSPTTYQSGGYKRIQTYYQWVNLAFLAQALILHLPHLLWKAYESGYIERLTAGLQVALHKEQKRSLELCYLAKFLVITQGKHKTYTIVYVFCEVCNFLAVVSQIVFLVNFFDVTGVPDYIPVDLSTWAGYRQFYFPPVGNCLISSYTATGLPRTIEAVCVLPLNHLYMRIFLFVRAWYVFLILLTGLVVIYRMVLILPVVRTVVLRAFAPMSSKSTVLSVCHQLSYSDWFFLVALQKSLTDADFSKLLEKMISVSQNRGKDEIDDDERSSVYEDSHKDLNMSPRTTPL
ncbi:innexin inx2 [Trichonephila clavata]|uniref:Innexin n=1 Tax=Trichonephila clavata TaxID=2740835 RepID=A0A8X6G4W9_TRICU|nr:innexin inx2 [Trichonephila clavata]